MGPPWGARMRRVRASERCSSCIFIQSSWAAGLSDEAADLQLTRPLPGRTSPGPLAMWGLISVACLSSLIHEHRLLHAPILSSCTPFPAQYWSLFLPCSSLSHVPIPSLDSAVMQRAAPVSLHVTNISGVEECQGLHQATVASTQGWACLF